MPAVDKRDILPGIRGQDYSFVRHGDQVYVVYRLKLPNGRTIQLAWRISKDQYKIYGVDLAKVRRVTASGFKALQVFGNAEEIQRSGDDSHPFQKFLRHLRELYGPVSWMQNQQFMGVMLMGWAENWSSVELQTRLERTSWFQNRTAYQRQWEQTSKAERRATMGTWETRITQELEALYGENVTLGEAGISREQIRTWASDIASGKMGANAEESFEVWAAKERNRIEKITGTAAWIEREAAAEAEREFMNRPEDVFEQLRQEAAMWLGPNRLDSSTLQRWAEDLVSAKSSQADWQQFLQTQAQALYPFLGPNEPWQDRASAYKAIVEQTWGTTIGWDDPILSKIGATDEGGAFTGGAMPYDDFEILLRQAPQFWVGPVAREEGWNLAGYLNNIFTGEI